MRGVALGLQDIKQSSSTPASLREKEGRKHALLEGNQPQCEEHERSGFFHDL